MDQSGKDLSHQYRNVSSGSGNEALPHGLFGVELLLLCWLRLFETLTMIPLVVPTVALEQCQTSRADPGHTGDFISHTFLRNMWRSLRRSWKL